MNHSPASPCPIRTVYAAKKKRAKKEVVFYTHFEEVLQKINPFGRYQIFTMIVILYASIEWAGNSTFIEVLGSIEPNWNCTLKNGSYFTVHAPTNDESCIFLHTNCTKYTAEKKSVGFVSLVGDFKMICNDADKVKWIQVIQAGGSLVGSIIGGHMGDYYGRKTMFFIGQLFIIITSIMSTASRNWIAYACIQGMNCFLYGVIEVTSLTMMMEYTNNKYRIVMASAFQWPIAYIVISLIAFLTKISQSPFHKHFQQQ
ncbi:hypothetical protein KIN20_006617 [Parelaphostrongylus tenuis]|uniref:Major facilitator superfamily (MFS) profile domain-containing protein n=1 Tax=Parelaphostrongylus tenuis TaxID=148309 RepID=A0AAD5QGY6_PARTN|nr:hypothetical protein KIN20_006617 [Parelaphostrongylus tenuis]